MSSDEDSPGSPGTPPDGWSRDVRNWLDHQYMELALSELPKALEEHCPYISRNHVRHGYVRWLELHLRYPNPKSSPWEATLVQWAVDMRERGFQYDELMKEVKIWMELNGPASEPYRRRPPMPYDIAKAWPERVYVTPTWWKQNDYNATPPVDYICQRCNASGHFLQVCPTNMDPAFDKSPKYNYCCPICYEWGKHYSTFCPMNSDPDSIYQKRRKAGIKSPGDYDSDESHHSNDDDDDDDDDSSRGRSRTRNDALDSGSTFHGSPDYTPPASDPSPTDTNISSRDTELMERLKEIEETKKHIEQLEEITTDDVAKIRSKYTTSQKRVSAHPPYTAKTLSRRFMNEKSPSPTKAHILRGKIAALEAAEKREGLLPTVDRGGCTKYTAEKAALLSELYQEEHGGGIMEREVELETKKRELVDVSDDVAGDVKDPLSNRFVPSLERASKRVKMPYEQAGAQSSTNCGETVVDPKEYKPKVMKHSDFVRKLMECRPEMEETVNKFSRRATALDMWNDHDDRRFKLMSISNVYKSPSKASTSPFDDEPDRITDMDYSSDEYDPANAFDTPAEGHKTDGDLIEISPKKEENLMEFS